MYRNFGLTLMLTHACNLRCDYCYGGRKYWSPMPEAVGRKAIDRALASLRPGGTLELNFFGGEPLLEATLALELVVYARVRAAAAHVRLALGLTTNGTLLHADAWDLMMLPDLSLAISHDGLPEVHDRRRRFEDGRRSSDAVLNLMRRLLRAGKEFRAVMVVHPDTVEQFPAGVEFLRAMGVRHIDPNLELWSHWRAEDARHLAEAVNACADIWAQHLPEFGISWFDEKAARLAGVPTGRCARCAFGAGEVAVSPAGHLYPCERLIGADDDSNPMRLTGHVLDGADFLPFPDPPVRSVEACRQCRIAHLCDTTCRCSNYVRTGDVRKPDGLLCLLNRVLVSETARVLKELQPRIAQCA